MKLFHALFAGALATNVVTGHEQTMRFMQVEVGENEIYYPQGTLDIEEDTEEDTIVDVAVIGGGLAGIYSAWRLLTTHENINPNISPNADVHYSSNENVSKVENFTVSLFELSDRIGGRLLSIVPPDNPEVKAEFGPMYFDRSHPLSELILEKFDISTKDFPSIEDSNINYFRGEHIRESKMDKSDLPFHLNWVEEGKHPREILYDALETIVPGSNSFNSSQWQDLKKEYKFDGEYLYKQGLWNVLLKVLSHEAYKLIHAYLGSDSILSDWNAAEGLHNLCKYHVKERDFVTPEEGMEMIPLILRDKFLEAGGNIYYNHRMTEFHRKMVSSTSNEIGLNETMANETMTNETMTNETMTNETMTNETMTDENVSTIDQYYTIHFEGQPSIKARHIILALPRRSLELINQKNGFFEEDTVRSLIATVTQIRSSKLFMCYDDPWWTNSASVNGGRSVTDLPLRQIYYFDSCMMSSFSDGRNARFWEELELPLNKTQPLSFENTDDRWGYLKASPRMVQHAQQQLREVHDQKHIDEPISASYISWSREPFGGAGHMWKVGTKPWEVKESIMKPLSDWSVYIVGEAYSGEQNMVEGDLETSEAMLQEYFFTKEVQGNFYQRGAALRGVADGDQFGIDVSTSGDGSRIAIASTVNDGNGGVSRHVNIYKWFGSGDIGFWDQIGFNIGSQTFEPDSEFAYSISLSGNGDHLAIGAAGNDGNGTHIEHVQVFMYGTNGMWSQVGQDIKTGTEGQFVAVNGDAAHVSWFGSSVSLSEHGTKLAVGAPQNANGTGAVFVLAYSINGWSQQGDVIDGNVEMGHFGWSVSLSRNGSHVAVGAPHTYGNGTSSGYVSVFSMDDGWSKQGSDIYGLENDDEFGHAVSLSGDGDRVAVGAPKGDGVNGTDIGYVAMYENVDGNWTGAGEIIHGAANGDNAGFSVSLAHEGNVLFVGMPGDEIIDDRNTGRVIVYKLVRESSTRSTGMLWEQVGMELTGSDPGDYAGSSVSASSDGHHVVVGAPTHDSAGRGSVRVWTFESFIGEDPFDLVPDTVASNPTLLPTQSPTAGNQTQSPSEIETPESPLNMRSLAMFDSDILGGYSDCDNLKTDIQTALEIEATILIENQSKEASTGGCITVAHSPVDTGNSSEIETSYGTNNQVDGVEEADAVQSDGKHIFMAYGNQIIVIDLEGTVITKEEVPSPEVGMNDTVTVTSGLVQPGLLPMDTKISVSSLLLNQTRVVALAHINDRSTKKVMGGTTFAFIYEFSYPSESPLTLVHQEQITGRYKTARAIGERAHVVTSANINTEGFKSPLYRCSDNYEKMDDAEYITAATKIASNTVTDYAGDIMQELIGNGVMSSCQHIVKINSMTSGSTDAMDSAMSGDKNFNVRHGGVLDSFHQVTSFDFITDATTIEATKNMAGAFMNQGIVETYVGGSNLVLAGKGWKYNEDSSYDQYTMLVSFELNVVEAKPSAVGEVTGYLLNSYSLDWWEDHLRVATTNFEKGSLVSQQIGDVTSMVWDVTSPSTSQVTVLEYNGKEMNTTGKVTGLGAGEEIFATRFLEDKAFVVTSKQVDPMYALDLRNPTNPKKRGEVKIDGFSNYMKNVQDDYLLTVGQEDHANKTTTGLKVALFNITNLNKPREHDKYVEQSDSYSRAQYDFHAFRYLEDSKRLIIPVYANYNQSEIFDGFKVYDVDAETNIVPSVNITHANEDNFSSVCYSTTYLPPRSMVFEGEIVTFKGHSVKKSVVRETVETSWQLNLDDGRNSDTEPCSPWYEDSAETGDTGDGVDLEDSTETVDTAETEDADETEDSADLIV